MTAAIVGVDGCKAGWVAAMVPVDGPVAAPEIVVVATLAEVLALGPFAAVAVDIPVGLPDIGPRACDIEARRRLGPRRSSVFPVPCRAVLDATDWPDALARSRAASGRGLPKQAWFLVARIAEADALLDVAGPDAFVEAHPELAFALLAGAPMAGPKRTVAGRTERLAALSGVFPAVATVLDERRRGVAADDILDACALAWTARRLAAGAALRLGDGALDAAGRPMAIHA